MGTKMLWTGLTFILAIIPALRAFGINANEVVILVGAIFMFIGTILIWIGK
jgi:hypothetical protein